MSKHAVLFFNAENLYDTVDDPVVKDSEFTPKGAKRWTDKRYQKKIKDVGNVICEAAGRFPAIIGLAEVENEGVLRDLIKKTDLHYRPYEIIHEHSPDVRGIDVSLIYDSEIFQYEHHDSIHIDFPWNRNIETREILHVTGRIDGELLHIFVNHWPSRNKGAKETEEKRLHVADCLRKRIDILFEEDESVNILLMGDFNDEPEDKSLTYVLGVKTHSDIKYDEFYNLMSKDSEEGNGTNVYEREWLLFDQFHASSNLIHKNGKLHIANKRGYIYKSDKVLFKERSGFKKPDETYGGDKYFGGVSDHLAVYCFIKSSD